MAKRAWIGSTQYTRTYSDIRGVELGGSGAEVSRGRLAYAENLYRDYDGEDGSLLESIPGYRRISSLGAKIHKLMLHRTAENGEYLIIHSGTKLFRQRIDQIGQFQPVTICSGLPERECAHFSYGGCLYIIADETIVRVNRNGSADMLDEDGEDIYIPILSYNGVKHEQKNLLTRKYRACFLLPRPDEYSLGTPGLRFKIIDKELGTCAVSGMDAKYDKAIYVPAYANIGGTKYRVTEVAERAFYFCTAATEIHIGEGVEKIGRYAFEYCTSATRITLPDTVAVIGDAAFNNCQAMTDLYIGSGLRSLGSSQFVGCKALERVHYAGTKEQAQIIEGFDSTKELERVYSDPFGRHTLLLPFPDRSEGASSVKINGEEVSFGGLVVDGQIKGAVVHVHTDWSSPVEIEMTATLVSDKYDFGQDGEYHGRAAIHASRVAEVFDNRVFLSGSSVLPNTVFYSSIERAGRENPLYFGAESFFSDGVGAYPVSALLSVNDSLAVFKKGDDGSGSIFYHTPYETSDDYLPKIYPRSYVHSGISAVGGALSFMDDPVFLARDGVYALDKKTINYDRNVVCRSHNVNYDLQKEDLSRAKLTEWCGYLVVLIGDRAYLADSRATFKHRTGGVEYEWFMLKGLCSRKGGREVFRFDSREIGNIYAYEKPGEIYDGTIFSTEIEGEQILYAVIDRVRYSISLSGEMTGGEVFMPTAILGSDKLLFFGTEEGALMLFNNDKRGVPPDDIAEAEDFDAEEYREVMGARIHPSFYSFEQRAVRYALKTAYDNCDLPHLVKSTVKHSLVLRCKTCSGATLRCEVGTESSSYGELTSFSGSRISFAEMDLSTLSLSPADYHTLPIAEKERGWVEKQIAVFSEGFASPIGISAIAYRYRVDGRVKRDR